MPQIDQETLREALHEENVENQVERRTPRWLVETLRDAKESHLMPGHTRSATHNAQAQFLDVALVATAINEEPLSHYDALESEQWMAAMQLELDSIEKNGTWALCDLPVGK